MKEGKELYQLRVFFLKFVRFIGVDAVSGYDMGYYLLF